MKKKVIGMVNVWHLKAGPHLFKRRAVQILVERWHPALADLDTGRRVRRQEHGHSSEGPTSWPRPLRFLWRVGACVAAVTAYY